jgi:hypothetical protein
MPNKRLAPTKPGEAEWLARFRQLRGGLSALSLPAKPVPPAAPEGKPRQYWIDLMSKPYTPE